MDYKPVLLKEDLKKALKEVGLNSDQSVIAHISLSSLGYLCGAAPTMIESILEILGPTGTLMMPSQSWKNHDPNLGVHWEISKEDWKLIRDNWPAYNKNITPTNEMGVCAELFRTWPGTERSDHPARSFCANGKYAKFLTLNHDLSDIFGSSSPLGKLYKLDGYVLLVGVHFNKNTSLHLAENLANYPKDKVEYSSAIINNEKREWISYETLQLSDKDFLEIEKDFKATGKVKTIKIGNSEIQFMKIRDLVDFATRWMEEHRINGLK